MELDNLKVIWNNLEEQGRSFEDDQHIGRLLQKRSQSAVSIMKRNLVAELIAAIVLYTVAIWYFLTTALGRYNEIAILLGVVGLFCGIYYARKYALLARMQCVTCEVRSNLQSRLTTLEKYVRFYFVSGTLLTPLAYFSTGLIVLLNYPVPEVLTGFRASNQYVVFIGIGVLITLAAYFFNRWYIRKLYGQHIARLKALLAQMDEF